MVVIGSGHAVVEDEAKTITTTYCPSDAVTLTQTLTRASETRITTITLNKDIATPTPPPVDESRTSPVNVSPDISAPAKIAIGISVSLGVVVCVSLWYWATRRRLRRPVGRPRSPRKISPSPPLSWVPSSPPSPGNDWPNVPKPKPKPKPSGPPAPPSPPKPTKWPKPKEWPPEGPLHVPMDKKKPTPDKPWGPPGFGGEDLPEKPNSKPKPDKPWGPPGFGGETLPQKPEAKAKPKLKVDVKVNVKPQAEHTGYEKAGSLPPNTKQGPESPLNGEPRQPRPKPKPLNPLGGATVQPPYTVKPPTWHTPGKLPGGKPAVVAPERPKKPEERRPSIPTGHGPFEQPSREAPSHTTSDGRPRPPGPYINVQSPSETTRHPPMPTPLSPDYEEDGIEPPSEDLDDLQSILMEPVRASAHMPRYTSASRRPRPMSTYVGVTRSGRLQYVRERDRERQEVSSGRRHTAEGRERESSSYPRTARQDYARQVHQEYSREAYYPSAPGRFHVPA
ncbi:hypothetical protein CDD81_3326 [Ophiocordyceps australis]|uniref:Uncharacterized protein n=1 Tax=Ophiocordyceps australis TaxID=1399860 RepID=A0A2C5XSE7_9HYPO|nr:hypothetical protein CDD81_3326 [Ophiocordyceps australis]